jgi:hypothetical protein
VPFEVKGYLRSRAGVNDHEQTGVSYLVSKVFDGFLEAIHELAARPNEAVAVRPGADDDVLDPWGITRARHRRWLELVHDRRGLRPIGLGESGSSDDETDDDREQDTHVSPLRSMVAARLDK